MKYGKEVMAYCYASGVIKFRSAKLGVPSGALWIATGPGKVIRQEVAVAARRGYDGKTLLVPGVPEAPIQSIALGAFQQWLAWCKPKIELSCEMATIGIYGNIEQEMAFIKDRQAVT